MLRYDRQTKPGLVALYVIRPGNAAGSFLQPRSPHGARVMEVVVTTGAIRCAKLYSKCHHQQTNCYRSDALPVTESTVSKQCNKIYQIHNSDTQLFDSF